MANFRSTTHLLCRYIIQFLTFMLAVTNLWHNPNCNITSLTQSHAEMQFNN